LERAGLWVGVCVGQAAALVRVVAA